jgi:4'-phosphopantetheinyl transferase
VQLNWPTPSDFPALSAGEIHVWAVPLDRIHASAAECNGVLSPDERARAEGFALDKPRQIFAASRMALRTLLGRYLAVSASDVPIVIDSNSKPQLTSGGLHFNLAHSGSLTLIAVTRGSEIGVDVELIRPVDCAHEIAARSFHPAERDAIRAANSAELPAMFMRCWTRKEAVLKAIGTGLGFSLAAFDVLNRQDPEQPIELPMIESLPPTRCELHDLDPCGRYAAAIAAIAMPHATQPLLGFTYSL